VDDQRSELEARVRELERALEQEVEYRRQLQLDLAIKDEYLAELRDRIRKGQPLFYPELDMIDPLQATRYRIADAINDRLRRLPALHRSLRWAARRAPWRR
jgi:hypothetical protein